MNKRNTNSTISVRLPLQLTKKLDLVSAQTERARTFHIQKAIEVYLEEYADLQIALDRLHDNNDPVVTGKDIRKSLGL
ncbi:MAG: DNA-binding protein [Deltaproteobacteria bacterium]|nr:DNA-binding protein [Deltaproteobacteria bacterium]